MTPQAQYQLCKNSEWCIFGDSPTLASLNKDYGERAAELWLVPQLTDLAIFSNCKEMLTSEQIKSLASLIVAEFYYLKMSELMLFFYKFKTGLYGLMYGAVAPMSIMRALKQFLLYRNEEYERRDREQAARKAAEDKKNAITYEEYLRRKQQKREV